MVIRHLSSTLRGRALRVVGAGAAAGVAVLSLAACGNSPRESIQASSQKTGPTSVSALSTDSSTTLQYTGGLQTITVPNGVGYADLEMAGGSGGNDNANDGWNRLLGSARGRGAIIGGTLKVKAGDVLTIAVAGQGGNPNGNKSNGLGGWSIAPFQGGDGGHSKGLTSGDGGGGGGASVIQLNGRVMAVAAGGGGEGGPTAAGDNYNGGGSGGFYWGYDGNQFTKSADNVGGPGGGAHNPLNNKTGASSTGAYLNGGGGGGGGGWLAGRGGYTSGVMGSGGGGGAASMSQLTDDWSTIGDTDGHQGNGYVKVTWEPTDGATASYTFVKTGTVDQLLEVNGAATYDGARVDTWEKQGGTVGDNQVWAFQRNAIDGAAGTLMNRATGKCLEVNGTDGTIDQWPCTTQENTMWTMVPNGDGGTALQVTFSIPFGPWQPGTYYLSTTRDTTENGDRLTLATSKSARTSWGQQAAL
ncbi:exported hypothetical protein [Nostocoides japonicum T1-X7]|uniref:receptor protein-tyrosine kinase n=1 Tax=Nostocoides japonicum T1-X7 TaxID=1194083 RepID=A0A077LZW0_9MICO|nr:RICIN domain-containing protein [Tetrasphaera japonica]CCH77484.1 exported hypothetical protein [Tetrasphaera japonica T1-X7]